MTKPKKSDEAFVRLIQVARGDPAIRRRLLSLVKLDPTQRKAAIGLFLHDMTLQQAPREFLEATETLLSDDVASTTLTLLSTELEEDHLITDSSLQHVSRILRSAVGMTAGISYGFFLMGVLLLLTDAYSERLEAIAWWIGFSLLVVFLVCGAQIAPRMRWGTLLPVALPAYVLLLWACQW